MLISQKLTFKYRKNCCFNTIIALPTHICHYNTLLILQTLSKELFSVIYTYIYIYIYMHACIYVYGRDCITPNIHMHAHLASCVRDYGPLHAFWLFSFERYNGILGRQPNNNRSIEIQVMIICIYTYYTWQKLNP